MIQKRNRILYFIIALVLIPIGLFSRTEKAVFLKYFSIYGGDTLWTMFIFTCFGMIASRTSTIKIAIYTLIFSYAVEISQLYHVEWLDTIRHTTLGALALGQGFLWSDLICYTLGVFLCVLAEKYMPYAFSTRSVYGKNPAEVQK